MDIPFVLLHVSTFMTLILLILVMRIKNKKALQYYFIFAILDIFLWCTLLLIRQYLMPVDQKADLFFKNSFNVLLFFLSALFFYIGYGFFKSQGLN